MRASQTPSSGPGRAEDWGDETDDVDRRWGLGGGDPPGLRSACGRSAWRVAGDGPHTPDPDSVTGKGHRASNNRE